MYCLLTDDIGRYLRDVTASMPHSAGIAGVRSTYMCTYFVQMDETVLTYIGTYLHTNAMFQSR